MYSQDAVESVNAVCELVKKRDEKGGSAKESGAVVYRMFLDDSRYAIDFSPSFKNEGWMQYDTDQDASYFGTWVNPQKLATLTYAEGDWIYVECPNKDAYNAEIERNNEFYGEGRIALAIDSEGNATEYRQDRSQFLA